MILGVGEVAGVGIRVGVCGCGPKAGAVLRAMLSTPHFRMLCESDEGNSQEGLVAASDASPGVPLARVVDGIRATWGSAAVGAESGLLHAFCGPRHGEARESLLGLCTQVDRLAFFVATLHPYYSLAHSAGDVSMLWLRQYLSHLLQELEKAPRPSHSVAGNTPSVVRLTIPAVASFDVEARSRLVGA